MRMTALTNGNRVAARNAAATVRHYVPGGCENGGGIGRLVGYISNTAKKAGETHLVTDTRGPRWSVATSPLRLFGAILMMAKDRIIAPARIHHIHVAGRGSTARKLILTEAARLLGCPHILHLHDYDYASDFAARSPRQQMLIRRMFQKADQVVALGQRDRITLTTLLGVDERRVVVIRNCVPDPGARNVHVGEMPLIVFLGRLSERKGVRELLLALSHPVMTELRWRAVLAGDGPVEDYRRQAASMGLSDLVKMPGWLDADEAQALCARADILVLPSHAEGLAMAVVEGLAHGLAVVTTRVGAHSEVISDGENGVFVPVGDKDALAAALAKLVTDPEIRSRLSAKARAHYLSHFSMKAYMRSLEKLYDAVSAQPQTTVGER
ncbi:glycosyltransferase family 4 protein [Rhizobium bangladeshense]|uniref:glycosyltransferase family 4 protein n=1 Tax=Rhizobium bangladeshense TaxID=1138189 RepID=UPI001A980C4C|nr:glycosyltransferase family 4 protein [Rhizobium bangladeshense]QSY95650.1 glycosyltransferase family 4 protein [Rhizobium bangladeshense]